MARFLAAALLAALVAAGPAAACFGPRLKVAVGGPAPLAAYVFGYYVEDRAGTGVEFVEAPDPGAEVAEGRADVALVPAGAGTPEGLVVRSAGVVPGVGPASFWLRPEVLDDLRFTLVERALGRMPALFGSEAYRAAAGSADTPRAAARKVVLDAP
ncbi:hypothetical protein [Deferrisoma sp.]